MNRLGRIPLVEMLRGVAATMVALHHFSTLDHGWLRDMGAHLKLGVEIFFVISGFVIPYSLHSQSSTYRVRDFPHFMIKRMIRLEPPYLASIALFIGLAFLAWQAPGFNGPPPSFSLGQVATHFLYLVPLTSYTWIQFVYWTLAYEFVFYIVVGLAFPLVTGPSPWRTRIAVCAIAALVGGGAISYFWGLFAIGLSVYSAMIRSERCWLEALPGALVAIAMARFGPSEAAAGFCTGALILLHDRLPLLNARVEQLLLWLGTVSYSLYLLHLPIGSRVMNLGLRFVSGPVGELVLSLLALGTSLVAATMLWYFVERPAIAASRRYNARKTVARDQT